MDRYQRIVYEGVVQGSEGVWQNAPHGVVVAPDGHVWINIYGGQGRMEVLASGDTVHYKGIYVLDPATGQHADFSPIEILTFPDGTSDSLTAESATSGGGRGIALDADGHILSSHYKTLYTYTTIANLVQETFRKHRRRLHGTSWDHGGDGWLADSMLEAFVELNGIDATAKRVKPPVTVQGPTSTQQREQAYRNDEYEVRHARMPPYCCD